MNSNLNEEKETREQHFFKRLSERGTLEEVWLPKVVYETYNREAITNKIIPVVQDELKRRAEKLFRESGANNKVVLVLKPTAVLDGKVYNVLLKSKSGDIGHTYYIPITKGLARTIILSKYKTPEEILEVGKQHLHRDYPETRGQSVELVGQTNYEFKIDLNKLMGEAPTSEKTFDLGKEEIPYKIRTDYRVGADFTHNEYGKGKIIATSSGVKGIGDSRGKLDWVDVDFGKVFVKGGKPTTVRRIAPVYTTVHFGDQLKQTALAEDKKTCSCGCNTCEGKAPLLNEGITFQQLLSENLLYHIKNKKPLTENTFRYGSSAFLDLWKEARTLYSRNILDVGPEDKEILLETNLGEYGLFEGDLVPLDLPMLEEDPLTLEGLNSPAYKGPEGYDDSCDCYPEEGLGEAKYQGKEVSLGKPKRGGSKKFYVYVKNPKTKKIIKVSFGGTTGLTAKINDSQARVNFAKRHNCAGKKDKTKPGYWACRLPRYAKLLGLKGTYSGYW